MLSKQDNTTGTVVHIMCDGDSYTLQGDATLVCLSSGKWSSDLPQCVKEGEWEELALCDFFSIHSLLNL